MKTYESNENELSELEDHPEGYNEGKDFLTLEAWKKTRVLRIFFYKQIIPLLPLEEKHNLSFQIRKAAVSSTLNIAEGYGRFYNKEGVRFYRISRGSIFELKDALIACLDFDYIDKSIYDEGIRLIEESKKALNGYIRFTKNQKDTD